MKKTDITLMASNPSSNSIAVMVVSCDNYSDLWPPFFQLLLRYWPGCPFPVYLLSNEVTTNTPGIINIPIGSDISWSDNVKLGLKLIKEKYVLLFIDDLFLTGPVDSSHIQLICEEFIEVEGNYLRLNPTVKADRTFNNHFGVVSPGTVYRTSTVLSLWNKDVLDKLLMSGETAWEFEVYGSIRSDGYSGFYATRKDCFSVENGVIKGKWRRTIYHKLRKLCPDMDLGGRSIMTPVEEILFFIKIARARLLSLVPARYRRKIKDFALLGKYNYKLSNNNISRL